MTCQEFIAVLGEYLEMTVTPDMLTELEEHPAERDRLPPAMPPEMKTRLRAFLLAQPLREDRPAN
jgi:hypothetical protein